MQSSCIGCVRDVHEIFTSDCWLVVVFYTGMVDVIFADVAQPDQARIVSINAQNFLKNQGHFVISIKVGIAPTPSLSLFLSLSVPSSTASRDFCVYACNEFLGISLF